MTNLLTMEQKVCRLRLNDASLYGDGSDGPFKTRTPCCRSSFYGVKGLKWISLLSARA